MSADWATGDAVYARYSSDEQNATSIDDQIDRVREVARRNHSLGRHRTFTDDAASVKDGTAPNWDIVMAGVRMKQIRRVFVDELSRVTRDLQTLLQIQRLFRFHDAALISVHERVDLAADDADIHVIFSGYKNQAATRDTRFRVKRGMDGNLKRGLSNGDVCFGYKSAALTSEESAQLGLPARPKNKVPYSKLVIDEVEANIIREVHRQFAVEKFSIRAIARRLNEQQVPRGGKARRARWSPVDVKKLLTSRRYLGFRWRNETKVAVNPDTGRKTLLRQRPGERIEVRDPKLVILDEAMYAATERRFAEVHEVHPLGSKGWKRRSGSNRDFAPKHLFAGTLVCGLCGAKLSQTCGHQGGYYGCPNVAIGRCVNSAAANRIVADECLLGAITLELRECLIVGPVHDILIHELSRRSASQPSRMSLIRKELSDLVREIENLVRAVAQHGDIESLATGLRHRHHRKHALESELREAERLGAEPQFLPDETWVARQLTEHLPALLRANPTRAALVIRKMTGPIEVFPHRPPWLRKAHLVARFQLDLAAGSVAAEENTVVADVGGFGVMLEVPLRRTPFYEKYADDVERLHERDGTSFEEIARCLPGNPSSRAVALAYKFAKYRNPDPTGRGWANHCRRRDARRAQRREVG